MTYYVYTNWTQPHARVHKGECPFCNEGEGIHNTDNEEHGKWEIKSYPTYKEAYAAAKNFIEKHDCDDKQINCGHCHPEA